jgi:hypothetical protein
MFLGYTNVPLQADDLLPAYVVQYVTTTMQIRSFAHLFYVVSTSAGSGNSCITNFLLTMVTRLQQVYNCSPADAKKYATAVIRLFINGIQLGMRLNVAWNEDNVYKTYVCTLSAAQYVNKGVLGWLVSSNSFANYEFNMIADEWFIPSSFFLF